jgi:hypothetical protein
MIVRRLIALSALLVFSSAAHADRLTQRQLGGMSGRRAGADTKGFETFMQNRAKTVTPHFGHFVALAQRLLHKTPAQLVNPTNAQADKLFSQMKAADIGTKIPDDFCFARAEIATRAAERAGFAVRKVNFVAPSGTELEANTANTKSGKISWGYHVAPLVTVGKVDYVLDPSLSNAKMTVKEWEAKMHDPRGETIITSADQLNYSKAPSTTQQERVQTFATSLSQVAGVRAYEKLRARDLAAKAGH